jgi:hypothetical protein
MSLLNFALQVCIILETAVVATHLTQPIDSPGITAENLITNKVTVISAVIPDKPIAYAMHVPPTAVSRIITAANKLF